MKNFSIVLLLITCVKSLSLAQNPQPEKHPICISVPGHEVGEKVVYISRIYRNCENPIIISVPSLGGTFQPKFLVTGGTFRYGNRKGEIYLVPDSTEVSIKVYSDNKYIGEERFRSMKAPAPTVRIINAKNNTYISEEQFVNSKEINYLKLSAIAEQSFAKQYSNEINYSIKLKSIVLARKSETGKLKQIDEVNTLEGLRILSAKACKGDRLIFQIAEVSRMNSLKKNESVSFSGQVISINVR